MADDDAPRWTDEDTAFIGKTRRKGNKPIKTSYEKIVAKHTALVEKAKAVNAQFSKEKTIRCLTKMKDMKDGWLDGDEKAPGRDGLDWLIGVYKAYYGSDAPCPYLYPMMGCRGVVMEWFRGDYSVGLEINLDTHAGNYTELNIKTDKYTSTTVNMEYRMQWHKLTDRLSTLGVGR